MFDQKEGLPSSPCWRLGSGGWTNFKREGRQNRQGLHKMGRVSIPLSYTLFSKNIKRASKKLTSTHCCRSNIRKSRIFQKGDKLLNYSLVPKLLPKIKILSVLVKITIISIWNLLCGALFYMKSKVSSNILYMIPGLSTFGALSTVSDCTSKL